MVPNHHHHHHHHLTLNHHLTETNASSSSSYRLFPFQDDQGVAYAHPFIDSNPSLHTHEVVGDVALGRKKEINDVKLTFLKSYNQDHHNGTTSSSPTDLKMRSFKTSMQPNDYRTINDQSSKRVDYCPRENNGEDSSNNNNNNNNESFGLIRACSDCGTTRTPLWRSGPYGPKSLCNACGIRQRKARRAAMAASDDTTCATNSNNNNSTTKLNTFKEMGAPKMMKKRSKNHARKTTLLSPNNNDDNQTSISNHQTNKKISFEEFALDLSSRFSLHQFFQQDEKEAAILLMALSSGFVEG